MIIRKDDTLTVIEGDSFGVITESKINADKLEKLFGILSGIYKNIHASIVREYVSNAWDANKMAGREDKPVMVYLNESPDMKLIIQDFGNGMSPETMTTIYFNYLDSTKEESNDVIGCFGIGSKSALAYTHTFYIDTIFEGVKYKYIFSKQSNGIPAGELLTQEFTTEESGTTITIPVKSYEDLKAFKAAIDTQLMYFPNVFIKSDCFWISNDHKLYEGKSFIYRTGCEIEQLHMCIGNVYYPIDFIELGIDTIKMPVAIKFQIGDLIPTPSRENIVYSKKSIKKVIDKIAEFAYELESSVPSDQIEVKTLKDYAPYYGKNGFSYKLTDDVCLNIPKEFLNDPAFFKTGNLSKILGCVAELRSLGMLVDSDALYDLRFFGWEYSNKRLTIDGFIRPDSLTVMGWSERYKIESSLRASNITMPTNYLSLGVSSNINPGVTYIVNKGESLTDRFRNKYMVNQLNYEHYFIQFAHYSLNDLKRFILRGVPKKNWRRVIEIIYGLTKEYVESVYKYYSSVDVPKHFIDNIKKSEASLRKNTLVKAASSEFSYERLSKYSSYGGYVWESKSSDATSILKLAHNVIYVEKTDRALAKEFMALVDSTKFYKKVGYNKTFTLISISKRSGKAMGLMSLNELIESDSKFIKKVSTAVRAGRVLQESLTYHELHTGVEFVSPLFYSLYMKLYNYIERYGSSYTNTSAIKKSIITATDKNGNYDKEVVKESKQLRFYLNKIQMTDVNMIKTIGKYDYNVLQNNVMFNAFNAINIPVNFQINSNPYKIIKK